jgi:hypothetical protein
MDVPYRVADGHYCALCKTTVLKVKVMQHASGIGSVHVCNDCIADWAAQCVMLELVFTERNEMGIRARAVSKAAFLRQ